MKRIKVIYGINPHHNADVVDEMTVGQIRARYREVLQIQDGAVAIIGGEPVGDDYVTKDGDSVEFVKQAGKKGWLLGLLAINGRQPSYAP